LFKFILRNWRGEYPFWTSLAVWSIAVPLLTYLVVTLWLTQWSLQDTPVSRMAQGAIGFFLIGAVAIWQFVGMWRASTRERAADRWMGTRWLARSASLLVGAVGLLMLAPLPKGMSALYREATDQDWIGQQGYDVSTEDTSLRINGYLAWGVLDKVSRALAANPEIQTVVLNSPGGHVGVGTRLYDQIRARGLDTSANELCASACTLAYLGGAHRYIGRRARLGFHAVGGDGDNSIGAGAGKVRALFRTTGIPDDFVERVFATPFESAWYPKQSELLSANIVTDVTD